MKPTARPILTHSLLATLALTVAAALAACAGESGAGHGATAGGGNGVTASGSAGAASGSAGASAGTGASTGAGAGAGGDQVSGGGATANVPAAAKALICPPLTPAFEQPSTAVTPPGFSPVAVVECRSGGAIAPVIGGGSYVRKEVAVADLGPLLAALREPSAPRAGAGRTPGCPLIAVAVPDLALIGRDGTVIYPRIPVTVCGAPLQAVTASLAALHWIPLSTTGAPQAGAPPAIQPQVGQPPVIQSQVIQSQVIRGQSARPPSITVRPGS